MARDQRTRRAARRDWTGEAVLGALRAWAREEGRPPRAYEWNPAGAAALGIASAQTLKWEREHERWPSLDVTVRRLGSWRQALQSAGLPTYPPLMLPLPERVATAQRLHGVCSVDETAELVGVSRWTIYGYWKAVRCRGCGGWQVYAAARTCLECSARARRRRRPPGAELVRLLRTWAAETGEPPRVTDWTGENDKWDREYPRWPFRVLVTDCFGSWPDALQAAGLTPYVRRWSDDELLDALRELARELGRSPMGRDLDARPDLFTGSLLAERFGSYERALLAAGLVPRRRAWTKEAVIEGLKQFEREHGRLPASSDLRNRRGSSYPPASAVQALFGDLHSAHRACGYQGPPARARFDPDKALHALQSFHHAHGRTPTVKDWDELAQRPSAPAIIRHYGSWNAALTAAGFTVTRLQRRWSDQEILAAIRTFEADHGRPPLAADFGGPRMPGFETVRARLGSLSAIIERARAAGGEPGAR